MADSGDSEFEGFDPAVLRQIDDNNIDSGSDSNIEISEYRTWIRILMMTTKFKMAEIRRCGLRCHPCFANFIITLVTHDIALIFLYY